MTKMVKVEIWALFSPWLPVWLGFCWSSWFTISLSLFRAVFVCLPKVSPPLSRACPSLSKILPLWLSGSTPVTSEILVRPCLARSPSVPMKSPAPLANWLPWEFSSIGFAQIRPIRKIGIRPSSIYSWFIMPSLFYT